MDDKEYGVQGFERVVDDHKLNGLNEALEVLVMDEPGAGGACHEYAVTLDRGEGAGPEVICEINFQKGPIKESGLNGLTNEVLLAVVIDRLRGFQSGRYPSYEGGCALSALRMGLDYLQNRTRDRLARGVEGTHSE